MPASLVPCQLLSSFQDPLDELAEPVAFLAVVVLVARPGSLRIGVPWRVVVMAAMPRYA